MKNIKGKVALITGAGSGIGRATALALGGRCSGAPRTSRAENPVNPYRLARPADLRRGSSGIPTDHSAGRLHENALG